MALSDFDRDLIRLASDRLGVRNAAVWHPGLMYRLFTLYWSGQRAMGFLDAHTRFTTRTSLKVKPPSTHIEQKEAVKHYEKLAKASPRVRVDMGSTTSAASGPVTSFSM